MNDKSCLLLVGGFPSGGTDLMKNILNAHPDVYISGEVPFLSRLAARGGFGDQNQLNSDEIRKFKESMVSLDVYKSVENPDAAEVLAGTGEQETLERVVYEMVTDRPAIIRGFKTPQFTEQLDVLTKLYPTARFLVVVRDIRDVCLSWERKWGKDKRLCADKWSRRMRKGWDIASSLPNERVLFVKYERLLSDTGEVCKEICAFVGIGFSETMLEFHKFVDVPRDGKINYGKSIVKDNYEKWKSMLPPIEVRRIEEIAYDTLGIFGYCPHYATGQRSITRWELVRGKFKDLYALLFIGNRKISNLNNLRSRLLNVLIEVQKRR